MTLFDLQAPANLIQLGDKKVLLIVLYYSAAVGH